MVTTTTIHVLAFGEGFKLIFNVIAAFVSGGLFADLLKISALLGIVMTTMAYLKGKDPLVYAKWLLVYSLMTTAILTPKTTITIDEFGANRVFTVANVPWLIANTASLFTNIGYAITLKYESLFSTPDSLTYSKTGMLFGSQLLQAAHDFHIINPDLKEDMNAFFRNCVVGDISINRKYSVGQLKNSENVFNLITEKASTVRRMVMSNGANLTCHNAVIHPKIGLKVRLDKEVNNAYTFFGKRIFAKPAKGTTYEQLFKTQLTDAYRYYQKITDDSANLALQNIMINAVQSGLRNYGARTNSSAAILNTQFSKTQLQHRSAWNIGFEKAVWFLPLLHTVLLMLLFAAFPVVLIFATIAGGGNMIKSFLLFLLSLQLWPMLFSIINSSVILYGQYKSSQYGPIASINVDSLDQVHNDLAGVAGFLMISIPFLARGFVSNIGESFASLATSITTNMQNASMQVANEVASASYSLGNNSFYNATANTLSANKHDTNYTDFKGQRTIQMASGATITDTGDGQTVYNSSAAISQSAIGVVSSKGLQDSLSNAKDHAINSATTDTLAFSNTLSQAGHKAYQFNESFGHDSRLGDGASTSDSFQAQKALAHAWNMAQEVGSRLGISSEEAFAGLTRHSYSTQAGIDTKGSLPGKLLSFTSGVSGNATTAHGIDNTVSGTNRNTSSDDFGLTNREEESFRSDLSTIESYTRNHHFDSSGTQSENLLYQVGDDLREARSHSESISASLSESDRISKAQNYVSTHSEQLNHNLNQEAVSWAISHHGKEKMDYLETHPANAQAQETLEQIKSEFIDSKASSLIHTANHSNPQEQFKAQSSKINAMKEQIQESFDANVSQIKDTADASHVGINPQETASLKKEVADGLSKQGQAVQDTGNLKANMIEKAHQAPIKKYTNKPKRS